MKHLILQNAGFDVDEGGIRFFGERLRQHCLSTTDIVLAEPRRRGLDLPWRTVEEHSFRCCEQTSCRFEEMLVD